MSKNYTQSEINNILLTKKLNDFYLAILERRESSLSDEDYDKLITDNSSFYGDGAEIAEDLKNASDMYKPLKGIVNNILALCVSQVRYSSIITIIGDQVYDICSARFENLKDSKIIHYENLENYVDESNTSLKLFKTTDVPGLKEDTVLLDTIEDFDEKVILSYEHAHVSQEDNTDLTRQFFLDNKKSNPLQRRRHVSRCNRRSK